MAQECGRVDSNSMTAKHTKQIDEQDHRLLAVWASNCAEHVLAYFEKAYPDDARPRKAVEAARAWVRGDLSMIDARKAAFASHAAARDAKNFSAQFAARAAGHAAATAHVADHARHAAAYAVKAVTTTKIADNTTTAERDWQRQHLPKHLHSVAFPAPRHSLHSNDAP
jgi:hypothetical protein